MRLSNSTFHSFVKTRRKLPLITIFLLGTALSSSSIFPEKKPAEKVKDIYVSALNTIQTEVKKLKAACENKKPVKEIQQSFYHCRLIYKKISFLIEFFNPYETRFLNGPALPRSEDDNPQVIIEPQGFQALEEILFQPWKKDNYNSAIQQLVNISNMIQRLQEEPDFQYKFNDQSIFAAFRTVLIRIATMDISGFDSPIAANSLPEAAATLEGINHCLHQYKPLLEKSNNILFKKITEQILLAKQYLQTNNSFIKFDRLIFLKNYLNPLFASLTAIRDRSGIGFSAGLMPVRQQAISLLDTGFFNSDFFSPNERYRITKERIELGRKLFFDPLLSGNKKRSCGTCHIPEKAFTDGLPTAMSIDENSFLSRNTPTLLNTTFQTKQFFDSRTSTLENQLSDVVHNSKEMKGSLQNNIPELKKDAQYISLFLLAYKEEKEPVSQYNIANAIGTYIRSLVFMNSRFDRYIRGEETTMNASEQNGFNLFAGKAKCATCHYFPLFNGLVPPAFNETESEVIGVPETKNKNPAVLDDDLGKFLFTNSVIHKHSFKTPTLRNIEITAPYMHNGVFTTLEEVMDFYNNGGGKGLKIAPNNQTLPFDKLNLSKKEITDIIAFMKTLTDKVGKQ